MGWTCCSETFTMGNEAGQGLVVSPIFWSVYLDPLFEELQAGGVSCYIGELIMGVIGKMNDLLLLDPSRNATQLMLITFDRSTTANNPLFTPR